jgi:hypothetical protein
VVRQLQSPASQFVHDARTLETGPSSGGGPHKPSSGLPPLDELPSQLSTLNTQHSTLNTQHSTLNSQRSTLSSGLPPVDELLPDRGLYCGSLVEWLAEGEGHGASCLAFLMARHRQRWGHRVVVIDARREFYSPGARLMGLDLTQTVVLHPSPGRSTLWAWERALRSRAGVTVIGRVEELSPHTYRRLKLAVEHGAGWGILLRPLPARQAPSWADIRLEVEAAAWEGESSWEGEAPAEPAAWEGEAPAEPARQEPRPPQCNPSEFDRQVSFARRMRVRVLSVRGRGFQTGETMISLYDDARVMSVVPELGGATARAARAS